MEYSILEQLPICVLQIDSNGECTFVNQKLLQIANAPIEKFLHKNWLEIFLAEDKAKIVTYLEGSQSAQNHFVFDAEVTFPSGPHWTQVRISTLQGKATGSLVIFLDISSLKNQAGLLFENEEKFRGAFENVSAGMAIVSLEGRLLKVNTALCQMLGYNKSEIEGKTFQSLTHPEDIVSDEANIERILAGEISHYQIEKRYVHRDSSIIWTVLSVDLVSDSKGKPQFFISHIQDVTQLKVTSLTLAEKISQLSAQIQETEKFKLAVESASDHIVITDANGIVIYANKAVENVTGYCPEEALGKKAGTMWSTPMPPEYYKNMWETIKTKKQTFQSEITNRKKNGQKYIASLTITPILDEQKNVIFFLGIERDISKEKSIDRAKSEFVSFASHQLRTPLTSVKWYTEMLLAGDAGKVTDEQYKYLKEIYVGSKRMVSLVTALLNVSRIEMGTFSVEPEPTNVKEIIENVLDELKLQIVEKKLAVTHEYSGIQTVLTDQKLIRIVFQNLFTNAIKYTPVEGEISIMLKTAEAGTELYGRKLPTDVWYVAVTDTGYGIPEYQKDKIFTKLFRADNVRSHDTTGTGLGLYITRSIITESGGEIWFESEENKGSNFIFWLPLKGMNQRTGTRSLEENHE
jgi:PAS domain S-box-containing protein